MSSCFAVLRGARSARLVAPTVLLSFALGPAAAVLSAQQIHHVLTGTVSQVTGDPAVVAGLAAHGVVPGAEARLEATLDLAVPGLPASFQPELAQYGGAVLAMEVGIGSYACSLYGGSPLPYNVAYVGDDVVLSGALSDKYSFGTWGQDTDELLFGGVLPVFMCAGAQVPGGQAIHDTSLAHDPLVFGSFTAQLKSDEGRVDIDFDLDGTGPGPVPDPVDPVLAAPARRGQLKAAAGFARSVLTARRVGVLSLPDKDLDGLLEAEAIEAAGEVFGAKFDQAVAKALAKGGSAPLPSDASAFAEAMLLDGLDLLAAHVTAGLDEHSKTDRQLRARLLGAVAKAVRKDLLAHAAHVKKPSLAKLRKKLSKSDAALVRTFDKAQAAAAKKGVDYDGQPVQEVVPTVRALVSQYVLLTLGVGPL